MRFSFSLKEQDVENAVPIAQRHLHDRSHSTERPGTVAKLHNLCVHGRKSAERARLSDSDALRRRGWS